MLETLDLTAKLDKGAFKAAVADLEPRLGQLQRRARALGIPVAIVFEGWGGAGKGTQINALIHCLDPRGFTVYSIQDPNPEEAMRPFLWRFWTKTPAKGRVAVFDRSWYRPVVHGRVEKTVKGKALEQAFDDIASFERQLTTGGTLVVKIFLHISRAEQKKRFKRLEKKPETAWRVRKADWHQNRDYDDYLAATEAMLARTDRDYARWMVVAAHDERGATLNIFQTVANALQQAIAKAENREKVVPPPPIEDAIEKPTPDCLSGVDLSLALSRGDYKRRLAAGQRRLRLLEYEIYRRRIPVVVVYEGGDAAGKGGNIRRLTRELDPRGYEVVPVGAPNDVERAHHYLWRFWNALPKAGHLTIFDRSWYGRVLVERVEGFCSESDWRRAYQEINAFERQLVNFGVVVVKFWLEIDLDEQLRRFEARRDNELKQWKITDEDWRNREQWDAYREAINDMVHRTSTPYAPWTIVESNCKWYARVKCLEAVSEAIERAVDEV